MKKNSNLLTRGKKVALVVLLATCLAGCVQENYDNASEKKIPWGLFAGLALLGTGMYGMGFAAGRKGRDKEYE